MGLTQKLGTIPLAVFTDSSNNVGIGGAANASFKLQVTGSVNLEGNVTTTGAQFVQNGFYLTNTNAGTTAGYTNLWGATDGIFFGLRNGTGGGKFIFQSAASYNYTFPAATGTLALTSNLSAYLPLTGGTLTGALSGTSATFSGKLTIGNSSLAEGEVGLFETGGNYNFTTFKNGTIRTIIGSQSSTSQGFLGTASNHDLLIKTNDATRLTIASTGAATFSSSVTATSGFFSSAGGGIYLNEAGASAGAGFIQFQSQGVQKWNLATGTNNDLLLYNNGGTNSYNIVVKHASGNVGIGTSSPLNLGSATNTVVTVNAATGNSAAYAFTINNVEQGYISTQASSMAIVNSANTPMILATNNTERMRITSGGQVQIKQSADGFTEGLRWINTLSNRWTFVNGADNNFYLGFNEAGRGVFNTATGVYTALSDINKKKDFEDSTIGLNAIMGLKPTLFRMKEEDESVEKTLGFIAQQVKDYIPQAYTENINGENTFIGLTEMPIIAALVKAVQEQQAQIEELKALISAK